MKLSLLGIGRRVLQRREHVGALKVGVVGQNFVNARAGRELTKDGADGHARIADTGKPSHPIRVHGDSVQRHESRVAEQSREIANRRPHHPNLRFRERSLRFRGRFFPFAFPLERFAAVFGLLKRRQILRNRSPKPAIPGSSPGCPVSSNPILEPNGRVNSAAKALRSCLSRGSAKPLWNAASRCGLTLSFPWLSLVSRNRHSSLRFSDVRTGLHSTTVRVGSYRQPTMTPDYIRVLDDDLGIRMAVEFKSRGRESDRLRRGPGSRRQFRSGDDPRLRRRPRPQRDAPIHAAVGEDWERSSMAVPLEKECAPRSSRSSADIAR